MVCSESNNLKFVWNSVQYNLTQNKEHKDDYEIQELRYNLCVWNPVIGWNKSRWLKEDEILHTI